MTTTSDVQATFVATLVDEWRICGVTDAVVCPGSRSTPLTAALAAAEQIRTHVVLDERSAGFVALGLGRATGRPALVVTTSGTAAVELHPAVVEADQAGVPLLVLTADRPPELHHVGAPQTTEQAGLYGGSTRWSLALGVPDLDSRATWRSLAARAVLATVGGSGATPGPVQLNLAFREPLLGEVGELPPSRRVDGREVPWHRTVESAEPWSALGVAGGEVKGWSGTPAWLEAAGLTAGGRAWSRGVLVAGEGAPRGDLLARVAEHLGWPLLADPLSGARVERPAVVAAADSLLRTPEIAGLAPEIVVRFGRPSASKVQGQWLASRRGPQVLVDPGGTWADPDRRVSAALRVPGETVAAALLAQTPARESDWQGRWQRAEAAAQAVLGGVLEGGITEPGIARSLVEHLPAGSVLMTASSMPVRDVEWYGPPRDELRVVANRGVNGIDGTLATAIGVGLAGSQVTLLSGDLAYLYDVSSLLGAAGRDLSMTVVVVDNGGGGIFSFLPQASALGRETFERYWGTPQRADLVGLARAYGADAGEITSLDQLASALRHPHRGVRVLVARTERMANVEVHDRLNRQVAEAVAASA